MYYKNFDRHASMTEKTLDQVSDVIRELMLEGAPGPLINQTYGLYDGYLYSGIDDRLKDFFQDDSERSSMVDEIFKEVHSYNFFTPQSITY